MYKDTKRSMFEYVYIDMDEHVKPSGTISYYHQTLSAQGLGETSFVAPLLHRAVRISAAGLCSGADQLLLETQAMGY